MDGGGVISCHNYKVEGNTAIGEGQYGEAEFFIHAEIEQAEQIGLLNPRLAGS